MPVRLPIALVLALLFTAPLPACIWSYGTNLQGKQIEVGGLSGADLIVEISQRTPRG